MRANEFKHKRSQSKFTEGDTMKHTQIFQERESEFFYALDKLKHTSALAQSVLIDCEQKKY
jgi:hypothetical protein